MLDVILDRRPEPLALCRVPGLDYYLPEPSRRRTELAALKAVPVAGPEVTGPELAALSQMYGYWTQE